MDSTNKAEAVQPKKKTIQCWHPDLDPAPRQHSWHAPFEKRQILPWIGLISSYGCFFGFLVPLRPIGWQAWSGVFVGLTGLMLLFGILTTYIVSPYASHTSSERQGTAECPQCRLKRNENSRTHHCSACNRCADEFDHHCPWINTCVTANNFPYFIGLLVTAASMFALQIAFAAYAGSQQSSQLTQGMVAGIVILSILPGFDFIGLAILLVSIMYFRLYWGMTTYEYLMKKGQKAGQKALDREAQRVEGRRAEIEKEQALVREEWRRKREKEQSERKAKGVGGSVSKETPGIIIKGPEAVTQSTATTTTGEPILAPTLPAGPADALAIV